MLNLLLVLLGPFVVVGVVWLLAKLGDRLSEKEAARMRTLGLMRVRQAEEDAR